jgi:hypothetical protein
VCETESAWLEINTFTWQSNKRARLVFKQRPLQSALKDRSFPTAEFLHVKPGKGSAFVRSKLKNYITNNTVEKTFRAGESVEAAEVEKRTKQYTYNDGDDLVFMDMVRWLVHLLRPSV